MFGSIQATDKICPHEYLTHRTKKGILYALLASHFEIRATITE